MAGIVVIFDFDFTIVDVESDNWIVDGLGFTDLFNQLLPTMPWNSLMGRMMKEIHSHGKTTEDIAEVLKRIPVIPRVVPAMEAAHALGCELRILSDANTFTIETVLKHLGVRDYFSEINTNPGFVDEEGRLRISPYHDFTKSPHGCPRCPPNMCKSPILERIQASISREGKRIIYIGDGSGDYCPSLKLRESDYLMPRKNYPMWDLICKNPKLVKAELREWSDGEELEHNLIHLINEISAEESNGNSAQLSSADCKLHNISIAVHETFPEPLFVPH
ncbi:inorganic pyrophosphatase 2 [Jatropha curcas]|uniref:inorganic pyrophosphatase 2 n=1 Tax=Jatropha curcas TaxID=180498 RepID=UPI0005FB59A6|nr:inorganic pyrophosphatase 2 [Jatropha curcas]